MMLIGGEGRSMATKTIMTVITVLIICNNVSAYNILLFNEGGTDLMYNESDTINFSIKIYNPSKYTVIIDVFDEFPDGNNILQYNGMLVVKELVLKPGEGWNKNLSYTVTEDDFAPDGMLWNYLYVVGENEIGGVIADSISNLAGASLLIDVEMERKCCCKNTYDLKFEVYNPSKQMVKIDIYNEFPDGNNILQFNGILIEEGVTLESKEGWESSISVDLYLNDTAPDGMLWNYLYIVGENELGGFFASSNAEAMYPGCSCETYDVNKDGNIDIGEVMKAITDYMDGEIPLTTAIDVVKCYFG